MECKAGSDYHIPVLYREVIDGLNIRPNTLVVDGTLGGGGHTELILKQNRTVKVLGVDRDMEAINFATKKINSKRLTTVHSNYREIINILNEKNLKADGVLLDLGVSSHQIDDSARGFSFRFDAPLDMRMDTSDSLTAEDVVNNYSEENLVKIFSEYGEEKFSKRIASAIVKARPINTTFELKSVIESVVNKIKKQETLSSVQRVFQAIRIEVNGELDGLYEFFVRLPEVLNKGARIAIISFHSLEDRIVKRAFNELCTDCICPPKFPVCVCNHRAKCKHITKKPITAQKDELEFNPRSSSAKLRVVEVL